jgi:ankyrin repeat protein
MRSGLYQLSHGQENQWRQQERHVKLLVERDDVEADSKDWYGWTLLSWAAEKGHEAVAQALLARDGVDLDPKDAFGQTPLSRVTAHGHEAVVKNGQGAVVKPLAKYACVGLCPWGSIRPEISARVTWNDLP